MHKEPKKKTFLHYCDLDQKKNARLLHRSEFLYHKDPAFPESQHFVFCFVGSVLQLLQLFYFCFFLGQLANHNRPVHYFGFSLLLFVIVRRFLFFSIASFCPSTHCVLIFIYIPAKKKKLKLFVKEKQVTNITV